MERLAALSDALFAVAMILLVPGPKVLTGGGLYQIGRVQSRRNFGICYEMKSHLNTPGLVYHRFQPVLAEIQGNSRIIYPIVGAARK